MRRRLYNDIALNTLDVKKEDMVVVLSGTERGKTGRVLKVLPRENKVLIEGVGVHKKHQKPRREGQRGQIVDKHHTIHVSKVMKTDVQKDKKAKAKKK